MAGHQTGDKPIPKPMLTKFGEAYIDGSVQDCSISIANALDIL